MVQEAFIKCYKEIKNLKNPQTFQAWFYRLLTRIAWRYCSKEKTYLYTESIDDNNKDTIADNLVLSDITKKDEVKKFVNEAIDKLSMPLKTTIILYYYNELSIKEISKIWGCFQGTVKSRLYNAIKLLENVEFSLSTSHEEKMMQGEATEQLENLFKYAHKKGMNLYGVSAYRSYKSQKQVYDERVRRVGKNQADKYVAYPGISEHQTGLAIDVTNEDGAQGRLMVDFGQTKEGKWLRRNAHNFGFILRYPKEKESITGYSYESWHIRYVGVKAAEQIFDNNIVLEEYLGEK